MITPTTWKTESGSVTILPERGRVLGIGLSGRQALWQPVGNDGGWNLGGERLWIGPETDWFWQRIGKPDFAFHRVPTAFNPDHWTVTRRDGTSCRGEIEITLPCAHRDTHLRLGLARTFDLLPATGDSLAFRISTTLEILSGTPGQPVDLWSILQLPPGGRMFAPTNGPAAVRDYFDPCPAGESTTAPGLFELKIGGPSMFKLGLQPGTCTGHLAYARPVGDRWLVLSRRFPLYPDLPYCDSPLDAPGTQGDAVQFFNDGHSFGFFGEMEHRSPSITCGTGPQTLKETTTTETSLLDPAAFTTWLTTLPGPSPR